MATRGKHRPALRAGLASIMLCPAHALAGETDLPTGGQVTAGSATIASGGGQMLINQSSQRAVIDWSSFDIGQQSGVTFDMPGSSAAVLNRVTGTTSSTLAGTLSANGQAFLVNPNGIAITGTGAVKVGGGFTASTLGLRTDDFMQGRLAFSGTSPANITHAGRIEAGDGGFAALLANGGIDNRGLISVPAGRVALGTGSAITLDPTGTGFMQILAPATGEDSGTIRSSGRIAAEGGRVEIKAASAAKAVRDIVNVSGEVSVASVRKQGGTIILDSGSSGLRLSGKLNASSRQAKGGRVALGGKRIALEGAPIDATGTSGGIVSVGGGRQGAAIAGVTTASAVTIDGTSILDASALADSGGEIIVWSNEDTRFFGSIFATGLGGDGGAAEVSSLGAYEFAGRVNLLSAEGRAGELLLDPYDVVISTAADANQSGFTATGSGAVINTASLEAALAGASVTVLTGSSGSETGTITVQSPISWSANTTLTLNAAGDIVLNDAITASGTTSGITLTAAGSGGVSGAGDIASSGTLTFNVNNAAAAGTYAGVISGTGQLVKGGAGLLTLSGANSYTGNTTISAGTLRAGSSLALGVTTYTVVSGTFDMAGYAADIGGVAGMGLITNSGGAATLTLGRSPVSRAFGGTIEDGAGSISIVKIGGAAQTLDGPSRFTGSIAVNVATLQIRNSTGLNNGNYAGDITISAAGSLRYSSSANQTLSGAISGAGTFTKDASASVVTLSNASGLTGSLNITAGTVRAGSANGFGLATVSVGTGSTLDLAGFSTAAGSLTGGGTVTNSGAAATLSVGARNTSTTFSGILQNGTGTLALTKTGTATLSLSGNNSYSGQTTISAGTLTLIGSGVIVSDVAVSPGSTLSFSRTPFTYAGVISGTGHLNFSNGMTFTGNNTFSGTGAVCTGCTIAVGDGRTSGTFGGNVAFYSGTSLIFNRSDTSTFAGSITGAVNIVKNGAGTLILTGNFSNSAGTTVNSGTLQIGNGGNTGAVSGNIGNAAAIEFNRSDAVTVAGVISGSGTLTKLGAATLTLSGANTYTGATTVAAGTLKAGSATALGVTSAATVASGATLDIAGFSTSLGSLAGLGTVTNSGSAATLTVGGDNTSTTFSGILQNGAGTLALTKAGTGTLIFTGGNTYTGGTTISDGSLQIGDGGTTGSISGAIANNGSLAFNRSNALTHSGVISGAGSLTQAGTGTLTLSGANSYTGATAVTAGTLKAGSAAAFGSNSALTVASGAIADLGGFSTSIGSLSGGGTFTNSGATATLTEGGLNASTTFSGVLQNGTGTLSLVKTGTGTLILTGASTYTGGTTVNAGSTLQFGAGGAALGSIAGSITNNGTVVVDTTTHGNFYTGMTGSGSFIKRGSATMYAVNNHQYTGDMTVEKGMLWFVNGLPQGNMIIGSTGQVDAQLTSSMTYNGIISGSGTLGKRGAGTLTLTANSPFTGAILVLGGNVQIGNGGTSGNIAGPIVFQGGNFLTFDRSDDFTFAGAVTGGSLVKNGAGTMVATGVLSPTSTTISGGTLRIGDGGTSGSLSGSVTNNAALVFNRSNSLTFGGIVSGTGSLIKLGAGTLTLTGANSYTGATTVTSGTLMAGSATPFGSNSALTVSSGASLDLGGFSTSIGSLSGAGTVTNSTAAATLTAGGLDTNTTFTGVLQNGAGVLALTKTGTGSLALSGTNTYTGQTIISGGTLALSGAGTVVSDIAIGAGTSLSFWSGTSFTYGGVISGSGAINFSRGMTFTGNNTFTGKSTICTGCTIAIGTGGTSGTLGGTLSLNSGANLIFNRADTSTFSGVASGRVNIIKNGEGTLIVTGSLVSLNGLTINAGTLQVGDGGTAGSVSTTSITNNGALVFNRSNALTVADVISGTGSLTQMGSGTLTLSGANTYTGPAIVTAGTLKAGSTTAFGSNSAVTVSIGGSLDLGGFSTSIGSLAGGGTVTNSGSAAVMLTEGSANETTAFSGILRNGTGTLALVKTGTGTLTLTGANTHTGATTVASGTLKAGSGNALSGSSAMTVDSGATLDLGGYSSSVGSLAGGGTVTNSGAAATLTTGGLDTSTIFSGMLRNGAGTLSLTKAGSGTLTLSGDNSFSGGLSVSGGGLDLSGSWNIGTSTAISSISSGAAFTGSGTITAAALTTSGTGTLSLTGANMIGSLSTSGTIGSLGLNNAQTITVGSVSAQGNVSITASGTSSDLVLAAGATISSSASGDAISLGAGRNFLNNSGAGALSAANGRWLVYSQSPAGNTFNGLDSGNTALWNTSAGSAVSLQGNRYVFAGRPVLTVSSVSRNKIYGTDATSATASSYTVTGFDSGVIGAYLGDSAATVLTGLPQVVSSGAAASADVGGYAIDVAPGSLSATNGYALAFASIGTLTVNRAALTVRAHDAAKTYDGLAFSGGNGASYEVFVNGETESVLTGSLAYGGAAQGAVDAGTYDLTVSGLMSDNYDISYADGLLTVNRAALTVRAHDAVKTYDGLAFSGGSGASYEGFVNGETESVLSGSLAYGGAAQGAVNAGIYGLSVSGLTSGNYDIAYRDGLLIIAAAAAPEPPRRFDPIRIVKSDPGWMGLVNQNACCLAAPRIRYAQEWLPETVIIAPWLIEPLEEVAERY